MDRKAPRRTVTGMSDDRDTASAFEELTRGIAKEFAERQRAARAEASPTGKIGAVVGTMVIGSAATLVAGLRFHYTGAVVGAIVFVATVVTTEFLLRAAERDGIRGD